MLERLIGFLPIILLFVVPALIGLRRAVRRRRVQGEAPEESGAQEGSPGRPGTKPSVPAAQGPVPRQPARAAAAEIRARPTRAPRPAGAATAAQVQEQYVYPSPLSLHRLPAAAETSQAVRATAARAAQAAAAAAAARAARSHEVARRPQRLTELPRTSWVLSAPDGVSRVRGPRRQPGADMPWRRLEALPPLQKAVLFSEILAPPKALRRDEGGSFPDREG